EPLLLLRDGPAPHRRSLLQHRDPLPRPPQVRRRRQPREPAAYHHNVCRPVHRRLPFLGRARSRGPKGYEVGGDPVGWPPRDALRRGPTVSCVLSTKGSVLMTVSTSPVPAKTSDHPPPGPPAK